MFAWLLSLYVCTGPSFLNMGPVCSWHQTDRAPYSSREDCGRDGKALLAAGTDKSIRMYRCVIIPTPKP